MVALLVKSRIFTTCFLFQTKQQKLRRGGGKISIQEGKNLKCIVFFNVHLFIYFHVWIIFIFSNFLKMCQLKKILYTCVDIQNSFGLERKVCWCAGIENFNQSRMNFCDVWVCLSTSIFYGYKQIKSFVERAFKIIFGDYKKFRKRKRGNIKIITYIQLN